MIPATTRTNLENIVLQEKRKLHKEAGIYNGVKIVYSINMLEKLNRYMQKMKLNHLPSYTIYKNKLKMD